jgi:DNA polymerase alpha-associated DNA helicase A
MFSEFFNAQRNLLARERQEEVDRTSLLLTHTDAKHLEAKGLALGSLGILSSSSVGLDGKMYSTCASAQL